MKVPLGAFLFYLFWTVAPAVHLPQAFSGWQSQKADVVSAAGLSALAGQNLGVVQEYGALQAERREYTRQNSHLPGTLTVTLWKMQDTTGSYGLFTYLRQPGMTSRTSPDEEAGGPDLFLLQRGPYLVEARGAQISFENGALIAAQIPSVRGREGLLPPLPQYFPQEGFLPSSQKVVIGPLALEHEEQIIPPAAIGFDAGAEAAIAQYRVGKGTAQLLLVSYPTPQLAENKLRTFEQLPAVSGGHVVVERKSSLIAFVLEPPSAAAAHRLLDHIRYGVNVTWNQKYVPPDRENVAPMMMAIFSLAGFLLVFCLVAGLALGGFRAVAKRFIPIPLFDRPSQMEIIQLNLSSK